MKTATVRDLRNHYTKLLAWIAAGEEIIITQKGKSIARLCPEPDHGTAEVNWIQSAAVTRNRSGERVMSAAESAEILAGAGEQW